MPRSLSWLHRNASVFCFFSASTFLHGLCLLYGLFCLVSMLFDPLGNMVITHPDMPRWRLVVPKGRALFACWLVLYLCVVLCSPAAHTGDARWRRFIRSFVTLAPLEYFSMTCVGEEELEAVKGARVLLGIHPHGVYPMGGVVAYAGSSPLLRSHPWLSVRPVCASILFKIPLLREYLLWTGHIDASRRTIARHMAKGVDDVAVVVGGEKEALLTRNGHEAVILEGRDGFVRLACRYGYHLVPTYTFGQNEVFSVLASGAFARLQALLRRKLRWCIPIYWGRLGLPMPHPVTLTVAVGRPILVPKPSSLGAEPDSQTVARLHAEYVAELRATFERHKAACGYGDRQLHVLSADENAHDKLKQC
jgi:1-acyl-sn-glycerol-3-phosphate acyltransferase